MNKIGVFVHSNWSAAHDLAEDVERGLRQRGVGAVWHTSDWDDSRLVDYMPGTDLLICLGGDGTVLRAARTVIPDPVPILGVNMGRLGFLAEIQPPQLMDALDDILAGKYRVEERSMLQAQIPSWGVTYHALNDVVVGRETLSRPVYVEVAVDGSRLAIHRCDAVIVASATGSTAYSLSAGGPILHPESRDIVLTPVAPHMAAARPVVLPPESVVELTVNADQNAIVSVDGQVDRSLHGGDSVSVCRSPHTARFIRFSKPQEYYSLLAERLDWLRVLRATEHPELFDLNGIASSA